MQKPLDIKAKELNIKICPEGNVHVLPVIAGFVGADAVADILSSGIYESRELSLLLDIGTNTEVFVGNSEDILSCSCASGPAFEGSHVRHVPDVSTEKIKFVGNTALTGAKMALISKESRKTAEMLSNRVRI